MKRDEKVIRAAGLCVCDDEGCKLFPRAFWYTFWMCMGIIVGLFLLFAVVFGVGYWLYMKFTGLAMI